MNLSERFNKLRFQWAVQKVAKTPPLQPGKNDYCLLSMVQHRDVMPYLLALKSFARFLPPRRIILVADATLNKKDREILQKHVPFIEIYEAGEFRNPDVPVGGTWERLMAIARLAADSYVVQLDADTVALRHLPAVGEAIRDNRSFTLGTEDIQPITSCTEIAQWAKGRLTGNDHIQLVAESLLDKLSEQMVGLRYGRGCSGFAGFARNSLNEERVCEISRNMRRIVGEKWSAWGTEQFTSNLLTCSAAGARMLPHPKYCHSGRITPETDFLHFIGFVRYKTNLYAETASDVIRELNAVAVNPTR